MDKITFVPDQGEPVDFYVLEQTRLGGVNYLLVTEEEEGDSDALILKDVSADGDSDAVYEIVSDDKELSAVAVVFEDILEDIDFVSDEEE